MLQTKYFIWLAIPLLLFLGGCAKMHIQVAKGFEKEKAAERPNDKINHQIILTGDAGHDPKGLSQPMERMMEQLFAEAGENATLLLLGDNIRSLDENEAPHRLNTPANNKLLELTGKFKGHTYFLPGDLEWLENDQEGVNQIEKWVQDRLGRGDSFVPDDGCPGPEVEEINDQLVLIAFDSRWYLENWNTTKVHNESCDIRSRSDLLLELEDEIKKYYLTHNIILAMHHPVYSTGRRGGYSSLKDHVFPFSNIDGHIYFPLPVLGSAYVLAQKKIPGRQDILHPVYREMAKTIDHFNRSYPGLIVVSAHDFNLQYHRDKTQHYIVSGSLVSKAPATLTDSSFFTYGGLGVARLNVFDDGAVEVEFIKPGKNAEPEVIFSKRLKSPLPTVEELTPDTFPMFEQLKDSITVSIIDNQKYRKYSENLWGKLNTDLFYTPVKMPVLNLDTAKGGLIPFRRGGSNQTNSVRLKDKNGRLYQIRSIKKNPDRLLPYPFNKTFLTDIAAKQLTAGNPFGAFTLAPMEDAIEIFHSNPQLVYVPKQPGLREFNDLGDEVYLLEERPDEDWSTLDSYGNSKNIISHFKMREDLLDNNKSDLDQEMVLRSRFFDMLIGDWDRHDDQWRWATYEQEDDYIYYKPVPRDRDQTYSMYGGLIPNYLRTTVPFLQSLQRFEDEIKEKDVRWINQQARNFDKLYLNRLNWEQWEEQVRFIQKNLTDSVIWEAMNRFPPEVREKGVPREIGRKLINRRDNLMTVARIYYQFLNKEIEIPATHKDNLFLIERLNDLETRVTVFEYRDDKKEKDLIYDRTIRYNPTKTINCYGLDGDDDFLVKGEVDKGLKIRLIGGNGKDTFEDKSKVSGITKKTLVYDMKKADNKLIKSGETASRLSRRYKFNHYSYKGHDYNYGFLVPFFAYNPDEGLLLQSMIMAKTRNFKKIQDHLVNISFGLGNKGFNFNYQGNYADVFGESALTLDAVVQKPRFVYNFYGFGNETKNEYDTSRKYRIGQERFYFSPGIRKMLNKDENTFLSFAPSYDLIKIQHESGEFISSNLSLVDPKVFDFQDFVGANLALTYRSVDKPTYPKRGLLFRAGVNWQKELSNQGKEYVKLQSQFGFYQPVGRNSGIVLASQAGFEHIIGDFYIYHATRIGGNNNLRGYANERFTGRSSFYHTNDLRIPLFRFRMIKIPTTFGITTGFDYGRVWHDEENSDKWHSSYGAHAWISPFGYFILSTGVFVSEEDLRYSLRFGFHF